MRRFERNLTFDPCRCLRALLEHYSAVLLARILNRADTLYLVKARTVCIEDAGDMVKEEPLCQSLSGLTRSGAT